MGDDLHASLHPSDEHVAPQELRGGRKRVAVHIDESQSRRRRTSARDVFPMDNEVLSYFPCPVSGCLIVSQSRAERSHHMREDHPGYKYKEGDGLEKMRDAHNHFLHAPHANLDGKSRRLVDDSMSDYSEEQQTEHKFDSSMPLIESKSSWSTQLDSGLADSHSFILNHEESLADGIDGGDFHHEQETYRPSNSKGMKRRGRPKNPPGTEPAETSKVRIPDPNGKYRCYIPDCPWRGGYRSIRAEHMKWVHKDWKMPPRYVLQRMSRDGNIYGREPEGEFGCLVKGCDWRGNYKASRSSHMRSQHPDFNTGGKKKAPLGGYVPNGRYQCHDSSCDWRGASRSTRAAHMKREHPGFLNPLYGPKMILCPDCNVQCATHKTFVEHLVMEHRLGGSVVREFDRVEDYEEWYEAVQDAFSVEFIKKMGSKPAESYQNQVTYLYCARSGGIRPKHAKSHPYNSKYMKENNIAKPYRHRNYCAAFLRILSSVDGIMTVVGCVEHTGHRLGTSILRLSPEEREIMDTFIYVSDDTTPMDHMLDKFREMENYVVDGFTMSQCDLKSLDAYVLDKDDQRMSLKYLLESDILSSDSLFNVNATTEPSENFTLGIMTPEMQQLWQAYGTHTAVFEEVRLMIGTWNLSLIFVLAFAEDNSPRCCCIYIANINDRLTILKKLREVNPEPPQTLITDNMSDWIFQLENAYGEAAYNIEHLTAEWHILAEWASHLDGLVANRVDRFTIFACLRRWLRVTDQTIFDAYVAEMFEAFRELNIEDMTQILDVALTDVDYFKKWNPLIRTGLADHGNPTIDIACRTFRDRYLNAERCNRLDQYIGLMIKRIEEFNKCVTTEPLPHGTVEPMRPPPLYELAEPAGTICADGTILMHQAQEGQMVMTDEHGEQYVEEIVELEDVEEEEVVIHMEDAIDDIPSTSRMVYAQDPNETEIYTQKYEVPKSIQHVEILHDNLEIRKQRVSRLLKAIQTNPNSLKGPTLDILENSLSQVMEHLDTPPPIIEEKPGL